MTRPDTSTIGPCSESELRKLAARVDEWVKSPEGQQSLHETRKSIKEMLSEMNEVRKIDSDLLLKRVTI